MTKCTYYSLTVYGDIITIQPVMGFYVYALSRAGDLSAKYSR